VSHAAAVKMEPMKVTEVIPTGKRKDLLFIKGFKFRFKKKNLADNMERWCCTIKKCKCYIKCNESREIFRGNAMHSRDAVKSA